MKKYRIIAIGPLPDYINNKFSGQGMMFDGFVQYCKSTGHQVTVLNIAPKCEGKAYWSRYLDYIPILGKLWLFCMFKKFDFAYLTSSLGSSGGKRDVVIVYILKLFRIKLFMHQFGADIEFMLSGKGKLYSMLIKVLNYSQCIFVEGDYLKNKFHFLPKYEDKVFVIPNGLPFRKETKCNPKKYEEGPFKLIFLSNLIYSKGYFDVLKAVDILVNTKKKNVHCLFAGAFITSTEDKYLNITKAKENFHSYIREHSLKDYVEYREGIYGDEKKREFEKAHAFLLPSYYPNEGQPVSILEAMSYGCVPIVTHYRHIPMMVTDKNGCFVRAQNPEDIANATLKLIEEPGEFARKSKECISDYENKFRFDKYAEKLICLINEKA